MSAAEGYQKFMDNSMSQISDLSEAFDDGLDLSTKASQLQEIGDIWSNALNNTVQMLNQIDQIQKNINAQFSSALEDLALGGMSDTEKEAYLRQQINSTLTGIAGAMRRRGRENNIVIR